LKATIRFGREPFILDIFESECDDIVIEPAGIIQRFQIRCTYNRVMITDKNRVGLQGRRHCWATNKLVHSLASTGRKREREEKQTNISDEYHGWRVCQKMACASSGEEENSRWIGVNLNFDGLCLCMNARREEGALRLTIFLYVPVRQSASPLCKTETRHCREEENTIIDR
jgi:hypothetical protein